MRRWIAVARAREIPPGRGRMVEAAGRTLALYNDAGEFFALDDTCPHQGASLGEGMLHQGRVICPWHSWIFDLRTGQCPKAPHISVDTYRVRVSDDTIEVEIPEDEAP
jgi:nitrite reductase (NADH) small subunit